MSSDRVELIPHPSLNPLLDSVDALSHHRMIYTWLPTFDDRPGYVHTESHPPLLILLRDGVGLGKASASSEIRIPIDADALEMQAQIRDRLREWCRELDITFEPDDLCASIRRWYIGHVNAVRGRKIMRETDAERTRTVHGWVRMIEQKFDPDEVREWTDPCPAKLPIVGGIGEVRCGARRVVVDGVERFAIKVNVTRLEAECAQCGTRWEGMRGLGELRVETNRAEREDQLAKEAEHGAD